MSREIFISYSQGDKAAAEEVCRVLESNGVTCWIAPRNIPPGATWANSIVQAIESCRAMILICSGHSNESRQMSRELQLADERKLPILPARLEPVALKGEYSYYLNLTQWLDLFPGAIADHSATLVSAVRNSMESMQPAAGAGSSGAATAPARIYSPPIPAAAPPRSRTPLFAGGAIAAVVLAGAGYWGLSPSAQPSPAPVVEPRPTPPVERPAVGGKDAPPAKPAKKLDAKPLGNAASAEPAPPSTKIRYLRVPPGERWPGGFWIGAAPVSVAEFEKFVADTRVNKMPDAPASNPGWAQKTAPMIVGSAKRQAERFCQWAGGTLPEAPAVSYAAAAVRLTGSDSVWEVLALDKAVIVEPGRVRAKLIKNVQDAQLGFRCMSLASTGQ